MTNSAGSLLAHQDSLSADIETRLAEQVVNARLSIPIDELVSIYEDASGEFEKLVAASVVYHFLGEMKALHGLTQFFLESYQLRLVREQRVLGLEDLIVELRNRCGQGVEVPDSDRALADVLGSAQRADGGADE